MIINYKEPYWIKYEWDLSDHKDDQYVTEFNKEESEKIKNLFHQKQYAINIEFKLDKNLESDKIFCIFGKPGKNFGLTYNTEADALALEFWTEATTKVAGDDFHYVPFYNINYEQLQEYNNVTIIRNDDEFICYFNWERNSDKDFDKNLIDDYREEGLLIGSGNPGTQVPEHRYHGSYHLNSLFFVEDIIDIETIKKIKNTEVTDLNKLLEYKNIIFNYTLDKNNKDIIFDNSENTYFLEKTPTEFIQ